MKKHLLPISLLATAFISIFASGCKEETQSQAMSPKAYPMMTLQRGDLIFKQEYPATIKGIHDVDIYPQVTGNITAVNFEEGMIVSKDQELFHIDPIPYEASYERARANVAKAEADLASAKFDRDARTELFRKSATSKLDQIKAQSAYDESEAHLREAQAQLKAAKQDLDNTVIKSPVNGILGMCDIHVGSSVSPSMSKPLISVSDNSSVRAYFSLTESVILFIQKASEIKIVDEESNDSGTHDGSYKVFFKLADGTDYQYPGYIDAMSGIVDKATGSVSIRATFPNPERIIQSGGAGTIVIPIKIKNQIIIPQTATFEIQDKVFVYKNVDGKAKATPIQIMSIDDGVNYVVINGLEVGDEIVTNGAGLLREGTPIVKQEESTKAPQADAKSAPAATDNKDPDTAKQHENKGE